MKEKEPVTRQAVFDRLKNIIRKGYLIKEGSCYIPTSKGLEQVIKDGGKTKHSYYDNKTNWGKASPTDDTSEEAES
jgi:predicted transcriptional regulator